MKNFIFIMLAIEMFGSGIDTKEKYPKYHILFRNNMFEISNKPFLLEGNNKNEYPGKCFITKYKKPWDQGTIFYPDDSCKRMTCTESGKILVEHCGAVSVNKTCVSHGSGEGVYPYCCSIFKCKGSDKKIFLYNPLTPFEGTIEEE